MAMMFRAEQRSGRYYSIVIRLRPDLCVRQSYPFIWYALGRSGCRTHSLAFVSYDALAVLPRAACEAYADVWRMQPGCRLPPEAWVGRRAIDAPGHELRPCGLLGGNIPGGFMYVTAGVQFVDLQHFWSAARPTRDGIRANAEPMLRRFAGWNKDEYGRPSAAGCYAYA